MKRLSIALAAIGLSAGAFAALPAATDPTVVNVPQMPGGFVIGATAFYLQPSDTNGDLNFVSLASGTTPGFASEVESVDPGYDWGWGVNVGYIFPDTGNDINLSYFHFDSDDSHSHVITSTTLAFIDPIFDGILGFDITSASAKAEYDIDQVDLTAGQYVNIGCRVVVHPFTGVRWASVERKLDTTYIGPPATFLVTTNPNQTAFFHEKSDFNGIGPMVGVDGSYYVGLGFGFVGHFDTALLVGNIDAKTDLTENVSTAVSPFLNAYTFAFKTDNTRRVVPVIDGKLGADYTYVFNNTVNSDLTLEVGYQVSNYFNAVDKVHPFFTTTALPPSIIGGFGTLSSTTSDVGLNGPYANLTFHA